jgi:hypothetical protein
MFVFSCKIDKSELLIYPNEKSSKKQKPSKKADDEKTEYYAVECNVCHTKVAVYENQSEIYHFFNVLASH